LRRGLRAALSPVAGSLPAVLRPLPPMETPPPRALTAAQATTLSSAASQHGGAAVRRRGWSLPIAFGAVGLVAVGVLSLVLVRSPAPPSQLLPPAPSPLVVAPPVRPLQPEAPRARTVELRLQPARAHAVLDGFVVESGRLLLPDDGREHELRVSATGYATETRMLGKDTPATVHVTLRAKRRAPTPAEKPGSAPPPIDP
jgi:hypothetical protein